MICKQLKNNDGGVPIFYFFLFFFFLFYIYNINNILVWCFFFYIVVPLYLYCWRYFDYYCYYCSCCCCSWQRCRWCRWNTSAMFIEKNTYNLHKKEQYDFELWLHKSEIVLLLFCVGSTQTKSENSRQEYLEMSSWFDGLQTSQDSAYVCSILPRRSAYVQIS